MSIFKNVLNAFNGDDNKSSNSGESLGDKLAAGVGKIHIPNGYTKNTAAKYFIPDPPYFIGCLNRIMGKAEPIIVINDSDFDAFKDSKIQSIIEKGITKLSISRDNFLKKPDVIYGPDWSEIPEGINFEDLELVKKGNDGRFRYVFFRIAILFYTEKQLLIYNTRYNIVLEEITKGTTDEYFYKDLIGVSADEDSFNLKSTGGQAIEIEFLKPAYRKYKIDSSDADDAVTSLRKILRDIKS